MKTPDHPLVPQERNRRAHVDAFANLTPIDESTLIERSQLLDVIVDDDGIEWKTDPFEMRPESKPRIARRNHCHDYIRGFGRAPETAEEPLQRTERIWPLRDGKTLARNDNSGQVSEG